ncbi:MAG: hypothetical protein S4CHLAM45_15350 [Chlamydiales bacterium]|nr:hypothetical protein [Chlamydiales bacterium]MCH9620152.1 hypothetical protein [Chlamydiales bacterium]MCH9623622.1 hypothetical protein [Chlamydiales bacterium]
MKELRKQIELLGEIVDFSPYLTTESRAFLEKQITQLAESIDGGEISSLQGEKMVVELEQMVASDEVGFLVSRISHFNPKSPRLELLKMLALQLDRQELSPKETRLEVQRIMRY